MRHERCCKNAIFMGVVICVAAVGISGRVALFVAYAANVLSRQPDIPWCGELRVKQCHNS
jgi:hypothetical protein